MPLLQSPIDGLPMRQIIRYGIEFDVCPTTGGVWLDKGELEKLIALVAEETRTEDAAATLRERDRSREIRRSFDDDDDDDRPYGGDRQSGGDRRRKSRLSDLFDF
jgi:uncharacterized protein